MRIDGTGKSSKVGQSGKSRRSSGSGEAFIIDEGEGTGRSSATSATSATSGIDAIESILALQAVDDPLYAKRKAVKRGHSLIDALEELRADLITGHLNNNVLERMTKLIQQGKAQNDPQLDAVIADIELRVRVELAKLGRFPSFQAR